MSKLTLASCKSVAKKYKATVVDEKVGYTHSCCIEAPKNHIWNEGDVHELVDESNRPWKPDYADLISRMNYGISECELAKIGECEWCNGEEA
jgi:hypothetical protein